MTSFTAFATAYRVAALTPAERTGNRPDECSCCDRAGLKHIVKLRHTSGAIEWMGTGCAAKALYGPRATYSATVRKQISADEYAARVTEELAAERRIRYSAALANFHADAAPDEASESCRRTYWTLGGFDALGSFSAWLAAVAETGEL